MLSVIPKILPATFNQTLNIFALSTNALHIHTHTCAQHTVIISYIALGEFDTE